MKMIARLSKVALVSAAIALPMASHADVSNLVGWSGWSHQVYVGTGAGFQYINNKTVVNNANNGRGTWFPAGFHNHRYAGVQSLSLGLANSMGVNYWAVEFDAYHSSANNDSNFETWYPVSNMYYHLQTSMPWRYEVDGVLGRYLQPNVLAYVKAGPTMGRMYSNYYQYGAFLAPAISSLNKILYGVNVGAGAQYLVNQHWRLGAEADFVQFVNAHKNDGGYVYNGVANGGAGYQIRQCNFIAKATINYLF
ncbi:MAG: hypothetical protein K0S29_262 [Gammaproteobacteria bacterium]|nr:hypothetical protein [Gammaproteobacteria bacterium]